MSKIICNVCGTSYPESSTHCPICGCVRPADSVAVPENSQQYSGYNYVRGGRFSKTNVSKRSQGAHTSKEKEPMNKKIVGLAIVLACLVIIVIMMVIFIINLSDSGGGQNNHQSQSNTAAENIPCTELKLFETEHVMTEINEVIFLETVVTPKNTTDPVTFASTETSVVTVDTKTGKVVCVGPGKAEIIVTCGDKTVSCRITCQVEPVSPETTEPSVPPVKVTLMRKNIDDAYYAGKSYTLFNEEASDVSANELEWITDDPSVAIVDQLGKVTAVGEGSTVIRVKYQGIQVASCPITCDFTVPDNGENPEGGDPGEGEIATLVPYSHYGNPLPFEEFPNAYTVTLSEAINEKVRIYLQDPNNPNNKVDVRWELDETYGGTCIIDEDGIWITANSSETARIVAKFGNTYYYVVIY